MTLHTRPLTLLPSFFYPQLEARKRPRRTTSDLAPSSEQQAASSSSSSVLVHHPPSPFQAVLANPDLLSMIVSALLPGGRASIRLLGKLACLNKAWKRISRQDMLWSPITAAISFR